MFSGLRFDLHFRLRFVGGFFVCVRLLLFVGDWFLLVADGLVLLFVAG